MTSEGKGQDLFPLSTGESELYALGALSAELIFTQAMVKGFGLPFLIPARADSSTSTSSGTETGSEQENETHTHAIPIHSRFGVSETAGDVRSQKNDVNPSDVGPKALGRKRFCRMRAMRGMCNELAETFSPGKLVRRVIG